jgi:hypothetical protein
LRNLKKNSKVNQMAIAERVLDKYKDTSDWKNVLLVAKDIDKFITDNQLEIDSCNQPGHSSRVIEKLFENILEKHEFVHEPKKEYPDQLLRPDFVNRRLKTIIEVERGKILNNNMDMLDFWKTHIHEECRYLILIVPKILRHSDKTSPEKPFDRVKARLFLFFKDNNSTNVYGLIIIGY